MPTKNKVCPVANWSWVGTVVTEVCMCVAIDPYVPNKRKRVLSGSLFVSLTPIRADATRQVGNLFMPTFRKYTIVLLPSPSNIANHIPGMADVLPGFQFH